jgi:hypothetical protein
VVERAVAVGVVDRAGDVPDRRGHRRLALRADPAIPAQTDPVTLAVHRVDEVASLRWPALRLAHHHLDVQRPRLTRRHSWHPRIDGTRRSRLPKARARCKARAR